MKVSKIVDYVNKLFGDGLFSFDDIMMDADSIIDEINDKCSQSFKLFSELEDIIPEDENTEPIPVEDQEYDYFADSYIRNVLCYGITAKLLEQEDEYESQQRAYQTHSDRWLYKMAEEYKSYIELEFINSDKFDYNQPNLIKTYVNPFGHTIAVYDKGDGTVEEKDEGIL